jgi:hypothetical protein
MRQRSMTYAPACAAAFQGDAYVHVRNADPHVPSHAIRRAIACTAKLDRGFV